MGSPSGPVSVADWVTVSGQASTSDSVTVEPSKMSGLLYVQPLAALSVIFCLSRTVEMSCDLAHDNP